MKISIIMAALAALFMSMTTHAESVEIICWSGGKVIYQNLSVDTDDIDFNGGAVVISTEGPRVALVSAACMITEITEEVK